ncbi:MAG: hypothetical protein H6831_16725 [Planctomycetes bacterium]|nr:hypothetical protein [Planctomycetota bacterium]MCB9906047.1 hypothetical protein [Planctomycetota bacterium]
MTRGLGWSLCAGALCLTALTQASNGALEPAEGLLQPFAGAVEGRYVDAGELISGPAPAPGTRRAQRWSAAQESELDALIVRPEARRGDYIDFGAEHSAWSRARD